MNAPGRFITVEGTEGAGKSTNIERIRARLAAAGIDVVVTREPGGTPLAEQIRELLLAHRDEAVAPLTELLLIFAARAQHLHEVIRPALAAGRWVLCDRFTDATFAYQGGGRQLDRGAIEILAGVVHADLAPDLTIYLDVPLAQGLERSRQRGALDRFELEEIAFFERVRAIYLQRAAAEPARWAVIDASLELEAVAARVEACIEGFLATLQRQAERP